MIWTYDIFTIRTQINGQVLIFDCIYHSKHTCFAGNKRLQIADYPIGLSYSETDSIRHDCIDSTIHTLPTLPLRDHSANVAKSSPVARSYRRHGRYSLCAQGLSQ